MCCRHGKILISELIIPPALKSVQTHQGACLIAPSNHDANYRKPAHPRSPNQSSINPSQSPPPFWNLQTGTHSRKMLWINHDNRLTIRVHQLPRNALKRTADSILQPHSHAR